MDKDIKNVGKFEDAIQKSALNEYRYSFYQKDLPLVLEIVDEYIDDNKLSEVNLADIGNGPGSITQYLKENSKNTDKLTVTCLDSNKEFLDHNHSADIKIETDLTEISHVDSWDIGIMRYVLPYKNYRFQKMNVKLFLFISRRSSAVEQLTRNESLLKSVSKSFVEL